MRRIFSHIPLIATLAAVCLAWQVTTISTAAAATGSTPINKAALNKAVQEALAKQTGASSGGQATPGASSGGQATPGASQGSEGLGSSGSLSNLTNGGEEEAATQTTPATPLSSSSSGVSTGVLIPIFVVGATLLGGIAFFIVRDARSVAPAGDGLGGNSGRDQAARLRKRRAKAKAARRQRKRNR